MTPPPARASFPVCSDQQLALLQQPKDINGDGFVDPIAIEPNSLRVMVAFGKANGFYLPLERLNAKNLKQYQDLTFFGFKASNIFSGKPQKISPALQSFLGVEGDPVFDFRGVKELAFEIRANLETSQPCLLGIALKGALRIEGENFFFPISFQEVAREAVIEELPDLCNPYREDCDSIIPPNLSLESSTSEKIDLENPYR
jgi:hypothetical protein